MNQEDAELIDTHHRRVRWLKRFMRYMPRRSSVHRYPGLKWVAGFARNRMYLWSFRYRAVAPALYAGTILSFLPLFGIDRIEESIPGAKIQTLPIIGWSGFDQVSCFV